MPCAGLQGTAFIDETVQRQYKKSYASLFRHFCRAKENKWCPPWIARNYEVQNPEDNNECNLDIQPDVPDPENTEDEVEQHKKTPDNSDIPHADRYKQKFVFGENEDEDDNAENEQEKEARKLAERWKPENRESWQRHSELGPNVNAESKTTRKESMPELVNPVDHDWCNSDLWKEFSHGSAREFWDKLKHADEAYTNQELNMQTLNDDDQILFVTLVLDHAKYIIDSLKQDIEPKAKRILLLGTAGSGKTRATQTALQELQRFLASVELSDDVDPATFFRVAAPSGSAAFQIRFGASTIHNLINWFNIRKFTEVKDDAKLFELQEKFRRTFMVFFDECSMIGRQMMGRIDSRFRQATSSTETLGNISVIAVGDPGQCEAIGDQQFYDTNPHHGTGDMQEAAAMSNTGLDIWQQFDDVIVLSSVHRLRMVGNPNTDVEHKYNALALR